MPAYMLASLFFLAALAGLSTAGYTLKDDYNHSSFFNMFDFFTGDDPTAGYVNYVSQLSASSAGLINTNNNAIYIGVDSSNVASGRGRNSVRLTSKVVYNKGLIILDLAHMPGGICGAWPAFWTLGPNWPANGEIDIIEGVNSQSHNAMTLHTNTGCTISGSSIKRIRGSGTTANTQAALFSGQLSTSNCDVNAVGQPANAGCQISVPNSNTYGAGFNSAGGGVYATEWTSTDIRIYFFPRGSIPSDISSGNPNPSGWGVPAAYFGSSSCNIDQHFQNHNLIFDTSFCGSWAGNVWSSDPVCASKASTCQDYVQNNPSAFKDAYWSINSLKVYQNDGTMNVESAASSAGSTVVATGISHTVPVVVTTTVASVTSVVPASKTTQQVKSHGGSGSSRSWKARDIIATALPDAINASNPKLLVQDTHPASIPTSVRHDQHPMDETDGPSNSTTNSIEDSRAEQANLSPDELEKIHAHMIGHKSKRRDF